MSLSLCRSEGAIYCKLLSQGTRDRGNSTIRNLDISSIYGAGVMGYYFAVGACGSCKRQMTYNIYYVPVLVTDNGQRIIICQDCHGLWNEIHRTSKGLDPQPVHPQAYEAQDE